MTGPAGVLVALTLLGYAAVRVDAALRWLGARYRHEGRHRDDGRARWRDDPTLRAVSGSIGALLQTVRRERQAAALATYPEAFGVGHVHRLDGTP